MRILLTGASSFTGLWFAETLAASGHAVVAPLLRQVESYDGIRKVRVQRLQQIAEVVPGVAFGDDRFMGIVGESDFDILAHHAAYIADYRSLDFNVQAAIAANTLEIRKVIDLMSHRGLKAIVATGSVFENDTGAGDAPLEAFSPYGLSKALTYQIIRFWAGRAGIPLGRFVIPNPFGPYEEPRFCDYLLSCWARSETAQVRTPAYVRDNVHVSLLAAAYTYFIEDLAASKQSAVLQPSGYVESQGAFTERFAQVMRSRLGLTCAVDLAEQIDFSEPRRRFNTDTIDIDRTGWSEGAAWDGLADYYRLKFNL